ncbi:MAG: hypothetical protein U0166_00275 [Acidobacteriota bacterium]
MSPHVEQPLSELRASLPGFIDVFVCCASYEERCLSIATNLDPGRVGAVLMAHNRQTLGQHGVRLRDMFATRLRLLATSTREPIQTADALRDGLDAAAPRDDAVFLVDITTFTHEQLLILLALLKEKQRGSRLILVYSGASEYMVGDEKEQRWLSHGIRDIRSVLGYPGVLHPSADIHLIVLVGFELQRAQRLVEAYEPATISLGYALPQDSLSHSLSETNQKFHRELAGLLGNVHSFTFSCRDSVATRESIAGQIKKFPGQSVVLAPLNTKVSTVGAALAAMDNPDIQLCYAEAKRYNEEGYSRPGAHFYFVDAPGFWK